MRRRRDHIVPMSTDTIRVNRAPVLTLWAAVVAERLGHNPETALSLASALAGTAARAKARRLGLVEDAAAPRSQTAPARLIRLLGRDIAVTGTQQGPLAAEPDGTPARPEAVAAYLARAFGPRLAEVRAAMQDLAGRLDADELNRTGFRLYEAFRPDVPPDVSGWGARAELHLERIRDAAG